MRILAAIYLTIVLVNFGLWLTNGLDQNSFPNVYSYLIWGLYFFSVLALLAFVVDKRMLPRVVWQLVFVVYVSTRGFELATTGLVLTRADLVTDLNTLANYLWLVLPAALAIGYLGFAPATSGKSVEVEVEKEVTIRLTA